MSEKWKVEESILRYHVEDDKGEIVYISEGKSEPELRTVHLIAAAPEMLELLRLSRSNVSTLVEAHICEECDGWLAELKRVITLAEGEIS